MICLRQNLYTVNLHFGTAPIDHFISYCYIVLRIGNHREQLKLGVEYYGRHLSEAVQEVCSILSVAE